MSGIKSRDFTSRCEGALDEIASVGGDISTGRAAVEAGVLSNTSPIVIVNILVCKAREKSSMECSSWDDDPHVSD